MDSTVKRSDINKRILETKKQTEELKAQLQNLIDSGINSSIEYKTSHSLLDKENIKESQNKVQIIKSYDTAHSQHINKPSSSKLNLLAYKKDPKTETEDKKSPKKTRNYDVDKAREYIKRQKEKRLEQQRLQNEDKRKAELQKQKLQELHKKSLELVTKNVQAKRERSKSRERTDFVRPVKELSRSRSPSKERGCNRTGKSAEHGTNAPLGQMGHINPNLLYPPLPKYMIPSEEHKTKTNHTSPTSQNKITIISRNSSDNKIESSEQHKSESTLKPKNLFNTPKQKPHPTIIDSGETKEENDTFIKTPDNKIKIISGNSSEKNKINSNVSAVSKPIVTKPTDCITELSRLINGKPTLENENNNIISDILNYKSVQNKNKSDLHLPVKASKSNSLAKPKISDIAIGTDHPETIAKETQTSSEPIQDFPSWLQERRYESNPLNFINIVKRKLQYAVNSPKDVAIQNSIALQNVKQDSPINLKSKEEIMDFVKHSTKSSKKSDLKSFISHKGLNLDQKTIDNIELIPKSFSNRNMTTTQSSATESESDTSKNIPEISSESGTSLRQNAESVKQNGNINLDMDRLTLMKLRDYQTDKPTHSLVSERNQSDIISDKSNKINSNTEVHSKTETKKSHSKTFLSNQYTSDFQSGTQTLSSSGGLTQNKTSNNSPHKNIDYEILTDPKVTLYSGKHSSSIPNTKHSSNIPEMKEKHSNSSINISINSESERSKDISKNITVRNNSFGSSSSHSILTDSRDLQDYSTIQKGKEPSSEGSKNIKNIPSNLSTESQSQYSKTQIEVNSEQESGLGSKKSDKYMSLYSDFHPSLTISERLSKSDSNLQFINTRRGSSSSEKKLVNITPLKEPTLSLTLANRTVKEKFEKTEERKLMKNISIRSDTNKCVDLNNTNEIHLKFEAEIHLLNDFNESLRQFSEVEKAFNSLKSKNDISATTNKVLQNQDTQTSVITKSSTTTKITEDNDPDEKSELSTINYSRGFLIDGDSNSLILDDTTSKLDDTHIGEDLFNLKVNPELSNFENLHSNNFAGMTLRMFEQLIKDEDVRLENLKTILKIREQALLDRTKGELAWLEIQRKHLRETGKLHEASLIKKKQRGILVNHQKERHEMQRLKQMQKAASIERKIILKEQTNLIKHQLSTDKMLSKIKVNTPRERRLSGPLKVIQSHTESIRSETSFSKRSSSDKDREVHSITSHTQSIVSLVSEVSGDENVMKEGGSKPDWTDMVKLSSEACGVPISQMKRTLLMREAALQKRRKAAEELLQWHRKLLEEEKRITELESTANTIISQIPNNAPTSPDVSEKYQFKGKQLNQLWFNLTGCKERKFSEKKIYPMSQIALERFCKSAREYSIKTNIPKRVSDSEVSENSAISGNIPNLKINLSASIRTDSDQSQQNSYKNVSLPLSTANEYTSDFDIESLHEASVEDMDVVDKSINQLINNFNKIQDDISSLSIKQSLKSDIDLEPEESVRSEKTDSDVELSVIETAKTLKGKPLQGEEIDLKEDKLSGSNKSISTSQDISDLSNKHSKSEEICETKISSDKHDTVHTSKSTEDKINTEVVSSLNQSGNSRASTFDKASIVEESILAIEDNLNKSQEILKELIHLEPQATEDVFSNKESLVEEIKITNEGKDNLSKSEDILSKLSRPDDKDSILTSNNANLQRSETIDSLNKSGTLESEAISLEPADNSTTKLSVEENKSSTGHTRTAEDSNKISATIEDNLSIKDSENQNVTDILNLNQKNVDLTSKISSENVHEAGESVETNIFIQTSEEQTVNSAIDEIGEISNKIVSMIDENSIASEEQKSLENETNIHVIEDENKTLDDNTKSILDEDNKSNRSHTAADLSIKEVPSIISEKEESRSVQFEEISQLLDSTKGTDTSKIFANETTKSEHNTQRSLKEDTVLSDTTHIQDDSKLYVKEKVEEKEFYHSDKESEIITDDSTKDIEENSTTSEKTSFEKSRTPDVLLTHISEENISQGSTSNVESENVANLLSKEDINSYEEKELDSLSSSAADKSSSSISEEKSPRSGSVDVKKRVSEIMADASQISRGDKSPKLQDLYTTTYGLVSPTNSPELGSPTEDHKLVSAKSIFGNEAEELLRKQLAIEQEIKQITEQQQKEQLPYLYVREIPNKPPPPYTPPSSLPPTNVITIVPCAEEIESITKYSAKILHKAYLNNNLDNISISENTLSLISKNISKECYKFVFDLCKEISKEHYKQFEKEKCTAWLQVRKNPRLTVIKPLDIVGLEKHMNVKLKELFGYEKPVRRENAIIKWSRKKRDHVDEILVMECQAEETQWTNYEKDELLVMNEVTNEIMNMLLKETGEVFSKILSKQTL